jgi:cell division protein FtsI (penicillin-binding protein 3)
MMRSVRDSARHLTLEGVEKSVLGQTQLRLLIAGGLFALAFVALGGRIVELAFFHVPVGPALAVEDSQAALRDQGLTPRADILDRNGVLLASDLMTVSLGVDPARLIDPAAAARKLAALFPDLSRRELLAKLTSKHGFEWIKRPLTPRQHAAVLRLGIPGLLFKKAIERIYPNGRTASHVVGFVDVDNTGLAGIERSFDARLKNSATPLSLSLDIRVQHVLRRELAGAMAEFSAIGAAGLVMDARTGEIVAMVSLPDFDPNQPAKSPRDNRFNRASLGVYEMGSTFKTFTVAMALEAGTASLSSDYDARRPIHIARYMIRDDHPQNRWLSVSEIYIHSSNIGSARMAVQVGPELQRRFLDRLGLLRRPALEIEEVGAPLVPRRWGEISTMTISYGHGLAVSPVQLVAGVAAVTNGGVLHQPSLLPADETGPRQEGVRVVSRRTSAKMQALMRLVVEEGTGRLADVPGYMVGGKTGTAEKSVAGGYRRHALLSSFVGIFPSTAPRYVVLALLDEPHGTKQTFGYAGGGWTAAPAVARIIGRIAPLLGVEPTALKTHPLHDVVVAALHQGEKL